MHGYVPSLCNLLTATDSKTVLIVLDSLSNLLQVNLRMLIFSFNLGVSGYKFLIVVIS